MRTAMSTIPGLMLEATDHHQKPNAFQFKQNGQWLNVSTAEFVTRVEELFHGLNALGIEAGDRVAILSENRLEWAICDYAIQSLGAIVVPIYPTLSPVQVEALLQDCEARLVFVSCLEMLEKVIGSRKRLPQLKYVIACAKNIYQPGVMRLDTLYKIGREGAAEHRGEFRRAIAKGNADDVATIIYTSGTTGVPKGAMLTHRNLVSNVLATLEVLPLNETDVELSFLPLSHIFQRHVDYAAMRVGATIAYAENLNTVGDNMAEVRPTFAAGVPRFFEKVRARILAQVESGSAGKRAIFNWAMRSGPKGIKHTIADRLVFQKIRAKLGGRLRWFISGGAALQEEVAEFFFKVGLPILEGYGLTETSPVISFNKPGEARIGSVGRLVGDVELRIAPDGEILVRGSNVMKGYFRKPKETQDALRDGWFHTGDVGVMNDDGFLQITDRKKDLIVTSTGKNIAPQPIENRLKMVPYFENVVLIGDRRNFITALVVPNLDALSSYARANKITFADPQELPHRREIHELAMKEIERRTEDLAGYEKIRKIAFLDAPFTIDSGELTPTLKVKRNVVEAKFHARIEELYAA